MEAGRFAFDEFLLDADEKVLLRDGKPLQITPKIFDLLLALVSEHGHIVEKSALMERVWAGSFVEESNLTFSIRQLRKALGDDTHNPRYIETVPRRGYRFIADLKDANENSSADAFDGTSSNGSGRRAAHFRNSVSDAVPAITDLPRRPAVGPRWRTMIYAILVSFLGMLALSAFFVVRSRPDWLSGFWNPTPQARGYADLTLETLTATGNTISADISPDGKLLAYISSDAGKRSVWVRQLATGKSVPILAATEDTVIGIGFSRDGEYLQYLHKPRDGSPQLSKMPVLGGAPIKMLDGFHSGVNFSPDERRIAFVRMAKAESALIVTNADGTNEKALITYPRPFSIVGLAWSPDGNEIGYSVTKISSGGKESRPARIAVDGGTEQSVTDFRWNYLEGMMWLPDGTGYLVCGRTRPGDPDQIWFVSAEGAVEQVTHDSSQLSLMGASADFSKIVLLKTSLDSTVSVGSTADPTVQQPVSKAIHDLAWTPDGRIVFPSRDTLKTDIWIADTDGGNKRQLTANEAVERSPVVSPDGKYVVFVSSEGGQQNIWRIDIDGSNPTQLTRGDGEIRPFLSPDGRSVYFNAARDNSLWQVPINGGESAAVIDEGVLRAAVSPNGREIAYFGLDGEKGKLFVRSFPDLKPLLSFEAFFSRVAPPKIVWSGDGRSVVYYRNDANEVGNLWKQPLAGGEPQKLTNFTSHNIFDFSFSPDGKSLAIARGSWNHDAVLLKGFR